MSYWTKIFFLLLISVKAFSEETCELAYSTPDQMVALTKETNKIEGIISPLNGRVYLSQTDLIAKGAQDVILKRIYVPSHCIWHSDKPLVRKGSHTEYSVSESGWAIFPHIHLDHMCIKRKKHHNYITKKQEVRVRDPSGAAFTYSVDDKNKVLLLGNYHGVCNIRSVDETPSAQYDVRNTKISVDQSSIIVQSPAGSTYHYIPRRRDHRSSGKTSTQEGFYTLSKEVLPSGKILKYDYNKENQLIRVFSMDPKERYTYASVDIDSAPTKATSTFSTNSGMTASYQQQPKQKLYEKKGRHKLKEFNPKSDILHLLSIESANTPKYHAETMSTHSLLNYYSGQQDLFACEYAAFGDIYTFHQKVNKLFFPGDDDLFHLIHEFSYQPPLAGVRDGSTTVKNTDGSYTIYEYSKELLLTALKHYDAESSLLKEKQLQWDINHWLSSVTCKNGTGDTLYTRTYQYDSFGNPIEELLSSHSSTSGVNHNVTTRRFSNDGRNLLLEEKNQEGKILVFDYLPNTNLNTAKFTKENDRILRREFYQYDDSHNLIKRIEDNGTTQNLENLEGVTQRKVTNYVLRNQPPFLHMPEWIEEKYVENGSEKLLKKTQLTYDTHGNVSEEKVYDAEDVLAYTLLHVYDDRGNLIETFNAIGQHAIYAYDEKGRCISSVDFSDIHTKKEYDLRNRLIKIEEVGSDQMIHATSFFYDLNDHLTKKIDAFQNETSYSYDPHSHKITKTQYPNICDKEGNSISVVTTSAYDVFGREISKTDANGNQTIFHYAGYAVPIEIIHPDQSRETFEYTQTGRLVSHVDKEGLKTSYNYDSLGRVTAKSFSTLNKEIAQETFKYDSFNLIKKIDREGYETCYSYDGAGRLVKEDVAGKITTYSYDALGRVSTIVNLNGDNSLYTHYQKDLLDRVLEKTCTDVLGNILFKIAYKYDSRGKVISIIRNIQGKEVSENFVYDSFQRQIKAIDGYGNETKTTYNENFTNVLGQKVLQTTILDPKNRTIVKTEDSQGRVVHEEKIDSNQTLMGGQKMTYDPNGNLLLKENSIYQNGKHLRTVDIEYKYNSINQLSQLTRAANLQDSSTISYTYAPCGKIATKAKSDGTIISYSYDPLGYLKAIQSSSKQLDLSYEYNALGHLLKATDVITKVSIEREVDSNGNILKEKLSTGLEIEKTYDVFNRPISIKLPDQGKILYTYDPLFLRSISRSSSTNDTLYTHSYTTYDSSGHLLAESLLGSLGKVEYNFDEKGRQTAVTSPYMTQTCQYDEVDNVLLLSTNNSTQHYSYDALDQLTHETDETYQYDTNYNRLEENGVTWVSNELDELLSAGKTQCSYDLNGNLISKKDPESNLALTYDPLDRLTQVVSNDCKVEMIYDPLGRRVSKTVHSLVDGLKTENYLYDGENEIGAFTPEKVPLQLRVLGLSKNARIPATVAIEVGNEVFAPIQDFQGNTRFLINLKGKQKEAYDLDAFGKPKQNNDKFLNPWRYASKRLDPETQLINFGKRYYDPQLGRWLTTDPAGFADGLNLYSYVKNNPLRYIDPDGRFAFAIPLVFMSFGLELTIGITTAEVVAGSLAGAALAWGVYELDKALNSRHSDTIYYNEVAEESSENEKKKGKRRSPYGGDELGEDPTKCPGEGVEWRGRGPPGTKGNWYNGKTKESFNPDLNHPPPIAPHWDYKDHVEDYEERLFLDGTWEPKKK